MKSILLLFLVIVISSCGSQNNFSCVDKQINESYGKNFFSEKAHYLDTLEFVENNLKKDVGLDTSKQGYLKWIKEVDSITVKDKAILLKTINSYSGFIEDINTTLLPNFILSSCCYCKRNKDEAKAMLYDEINVTGNIPTTKQLERLLNLSDFSVKQERMILLNYIYFRLQGDVYPPLNNH